MKLNRKVVSLLIGIATPIVIAGSLYAYAVDRVNDNAEAMAPDVTAITRAIDDPEEIARMTEIPRYSQFSLTWIIHNVHVTKQKDMAALKRSVEDAVTSTNDYELYTFMVAADDTVNGPSPEQQAAYAKVGLPDGTPKPEFSEDFKIEWDNCRQQLDDRYNSYFGPWALVLDLGFPDDTATCPGLKRQVTISRDV